MVGFGIMKKWEVNVGRCSGRRGIVLCNTIISCKFEILYGLESSLHVLLVWTTVIGSKEGDKWGKIQASIHDGPSEGTNNRLVGCTTLDKVDMVYSLSMIADDVG